MDDVFKVIEGLSVEILEKCVGVKVQTPFRRMSYAEAMAQVRLATSRTCGSVWRSWTSPIRSRQSEFGVFKNAVAAGGVVRAINAKGAADKFSNSALKQGRAGEDRRDVQGQGPALDEVRGRQVHRR